jgi:hypothetical protein
LLLGLCVCIHFLKYISFKKILQIVVKCLYINFAILTRYKVLSYCCASIIPN